MLAMTVKSPYIPDWEIEEAKDYASKLGVRHLIIEAPLTKEILHNPENRCYLCKRFIFKKLRDTAEQKKDLRICWTGQTAMIQLIQGRG